jgi:hypothetical protein
MKLCAIEPFIGTDTLKLQVRSFSTCWLVVPAHAAIAPQQQYNKYMLNVPIEELTQKFDCAMVMNILCRFHCRQYVWIRSNRLGYW